VPGGVGSEPIDDQKFQTGSDRLGSFTVTPAEVPG
jgi:hypothetical protein